MIVIPYPAGGMQSYTHASLKYALLQSSISTAGKGGEARRGRVVAACVELRLIGEVISKETVAPVYDAPGRV